MAATAAPALAAQTQASAEARAEANFSDAELDQVVCQRDTVVGSRVAKRRTCMTRREWIRTQNAVRDGMQEYLQRSTAGATPSG